jgi:hypothetical protein
MLTCDLSWANNCAANNATNGVDLNHAGADSKSMLLQKQAKGVIVDKSSSNGVALPPQYVPTLPQIPGGSGVIQSFVLDNQTGVVGRFAFHVFVFLTHHTQRIDVFWIVRR